MPKLAQSGASIVLIGQFTPQTYLPSWFAQEGIISEGNADSAVLEVLGPDFVSFRYESCSVTVERNKFGAVAIQEPFDIIFDLVTSTLAILPYNPISAIGINRALHFDLESEEVFHAFGDKLAPKEPWGSFGFQDGKRKAGLKALVMEIARHDPKLEGLTVIKIEPSVLIRNGVYFDINDHYQIAPNEKPTDSGAALEVLRARWDVARRNSLSLCTQLVGEF